ncbi:hypothetical protein ACP70R_011511 [Stipagrostis hirtigluma subsp. patula]
MGHSVSGGMEEAAARERKRPRDGDAAPSVAAADGEAQYVYLPIADALKAPGARLCLFAVVAEIGAAVRSRGTDFTLTLRIVDQSRAAGISVTFFADNAELLPCVRSTGDVISLHNVVITMHGEFFVTFNKKFSSFALFEGKVSTECSPYQTSMKYYGSKHDNELLNQMRMWLVNHPPGPGHAHSAPNLLKYHGGKHVPTQMRTLHISIIIEEAERINLCHGWALGRRGRQLDFNYVGSTSWCNEHDLIYNLLAMLLMSSSLPKGLKDLELQLRSIKPDSTFDLVCKVLHVRETSNGEWIFYVWDGTDTPATEFQMISDTEAVESSPLHLEEVPLSREVLCTMPCIGTVLRIYANRSLRETFHLQKNIYWARFCNITCKQEFGMWKGILLPASRVRLLSHEDGSVIDRVKMYDSRIAKQVHRQPMASIPGTFDVSDVEFATAGYTTLMESITHGQVTHKFKTLVRVVAAYPCQASDLGSLLTGSYCLRLTLEDPTARIHAYVHKDDGARFFGGFLTAEALIKKMNKLLGIPEDGEEDAPLTRNPPWIWCCLKSYRLDKNDPWGSRRYRIFGTEIRD